MAKKSSSDSMVGKGKAKLLNAHKAKGMAAGKGFSSKDIGDMMLQIGKDEGIFKAAGGKIKPSKYYAKGGKVFTGR
tara:strand:- start:247 stop:474 length:228 start_codon:yes stop_codon:yes gene_type:complete